VGWRFAALGGCLAQCPRMGGAGEQRRDGVGGLLYRAMAASAGDTGPWGLMARAGGMDGESLHCATQCASDLQSVADASIASR